MLEALTELVKYEPVEPDVFDLEDAPLSDHDVELDGDDRELEDQPTPVRPDDIGENE